MANLDFHIHSDCNTSTLAEATVAAIRHMAEVAEDFFHRDFSDEDTREKTGINLLLAQVELGKQVALAVDGIVNKAKMD